MPQLVRVEIDPLLARSEPDPEIQATLAASAGVNIGLDYLPGALNWEPAFAVDAALAARIVWFDALVTNVDRTAKNPNMLRWHKQLYLIDHGAALYFHHAWADHLARARSPFTAIRAARAARVRRLDRRRRCRARAAGHREPRCARSWPTCPTST